MPHSLKGLQGVVPPVVTPLNADFTVDYPSFTRVIEHLITGGVHGLFFLGSTSEVVFHDEATRDKILAHAVEITGGRLPVLAGVVDPTTDRVIGHAKSAGTLGVDGVVVTAPFYTRTSQAETVEHFRYVADASPVPVIAYDLPVSVHTKLARDTITTEPARGVSEMARVVRPGGTVSAYVWDIIGGGPPTMLVEQVMETLGLNPPSRPNPATSGLDAMQALWSGAGLVDVQTRVIEVQHRFDNFEAFWDMMRQMPVASPVITHIGDAEIAAMKAALRRRVAVEARGGITHSAHANAVRGRVPQEG